MVRYPEPEAFLDADLSELVEIAIETLKEAEELAKDEDLKDIFEE